nr:MAG TPA: hypothetical protein [Bacteriophage sp.]
MITKTITYTDYNGLERTEKFRFNLTKAELSEMELSVDGGFAEMAKRIADAKDGPSLVKLFKELILKSYGVKSDDGRMFMKVDEKGNPLSVAFSQTEAYSMLFMELANDADAASEFFLGVIPSDLKAQVQQSITEGK